MIADQADEGAAHAGGRRWVAVVVGIVVFGAVTVAWAAMPFDDHVPLVLPERNAARVDAPDELPSAASFECPSLLADEEEPQPSRGAVEAMTLQDLTRVPCTEIRDQRRVLVVVDVAIVLGGLVLVGWLYRRRRAA